MPASLHLPGARDRLLLKLRDDVIGNGVALYKKIRKRTRREEVEAFTWIFEIDLGKELPPALRNRRTHSSAAPLRAPFRSTAWRDESI